MIVNSCSCELTWLIRDEYGRDDRQAGYDEQNNRGTRDEPGYDFLIRHVHVIHCTAPCFR